MAKRDDRKQISCWVSIETLAEIDEIVKKKHDFPLEEKEFSGYSDYLNKLIEADLSKRRKRKAEKLIKEKYGPMIRELNREGAIDEGKAAELIGKLLTEYGKLTEQNSNQESLPLYYPDIKNNKY